MNTIFKASGLLALVFPISAQAADFYYQPNVYAPAAQRYVIQDAPPVVARDVIVTRRVTNPAPTRVIEQRIVQSPAGTVKTTRIYESYGHSALAPRPPRNIGHNIGIVAPPYSGGLRPVHAAPYGIGAPAIGEFDDGEFE